QIDQALAQDLNWSPPAGFSAAVVRRALPEFSTIVTRSRLRSAYVMRAAVVMLLAIGFVCLTMLVLVDAGLPLLVAIAKHTLPAAWGAAVLSVSFSIWLTRRVFR